MFAKTNKKGRKEAPVEVLLDPNGIFIYLEEKCVVGPFLTRKN